MQGESRDETRRLDPLFRWPGGKRWLVPKLLELAPQSVRRYFEPFFGAGALFFALRPEHALVSDSNAELMDCYRAIRDEPEAVARVLGSMPQDRASYYVCRSTHPSDRIDRAARLIYLTTLAFNGIYRVNLDGEFNVPYGGREYRNLADVARLRTYADSLASAEIISGDFEERLDAAAPGDLVYLDPPYTVAHANNGFLKYNDRIFSWADQRRLASAAVQLDRRGCAVIASNACHPSILELYPGFRSLRVSRTSVMAASPGRRGPIFEYVFTNLPERSPLEFADSPRVL